MNLQLLNFPENITEEIKESLNNVLTSSFWSTGPQSQNLEHLCHHLSFLLFFEDTTLSQRYIYPSPPYQESWLPLVN